MREYDDWTKSAAEAIIKPTVPGRRGETMPATTGLQSLGSSASRDLRELQVSQSAYAVSGSMLPASPQGKERIDAEFASTIHHRLGWP